VGISEIMAVVRAVGRAVLWLLLGLAGTLAILVIVTDVLNRRGYPQIQSGHVYTDSWDRGHVVARGTWVFEDDAKQAFPHQIAEIKCDRDEKVCQSAQAMIAFDILTVQTELFRITTWDDQSIVYVTPFPECLNYTYTISRSTNRVTGQRKPKSPLPTECEIVDKRTLNLSLRDGFLVWQQLKRDDERIVLPIMYAALGVWWAFIVYRIVRTLRRPALARS
jgi:hypothetical protein